MRITFNAEDSEERGGAQESESLRIFENLRVLINLLPDLTSLLELSPFGLTVHVHLDLLRPRGNFSLLCLAAWPAHPQCRGRNGCA